MLNEIYRDIIENDIIGHHKIRKTQNLRELAKYLNLKQRERNYIQQTKDST